MKKVMLSLILGFVAASAMADIGPRPDNKDRRVTAKELAKILASDAVQKEIGASDLDGANISVEKIVEQKIKGAEVTIRIKEPGLGHNGPGTRPCIVTVRATKGFTQGEKFDVTVKKVCAEL